MISTESLPEKEEVMTREKAAAKLRESFLLALNELNGQACNILTYEQNRLSATFSGWNIKGKEVLVQNLQTPSGLKMPAALVETSDIIAVEFDSVIPLP